MQINSTSPVIATMRPTASSIALTPLQQRLGELNLKLKYVAATGLDASAKQDIAQLLTMQIAVVQFHLDALDDQPDHAELTVAFDAAMRNMMNTGATVRSTVPCPSSELLVTS